MEKHLTIATLSILLSLTAASAVAATHPLNQPVGVAVDAHGNLYVANFGADQVLVYNFNYVQMTGKTVTKDQNGPVAVAFDVPGNVWVLGTGHPSRPDASLSEYSATGAVLFTTVGQFLLYDLTGFADSLAVDGNGDIWPATNFGSKINGGATVFAYPPVAALDGIPLTYLAGYSLVAIHGQWIAYGGSSSTVSWGLVSEVLAGRGLGVGGSESASASAMTFDSASNLYVVVPDGGGGAAVQIINVPAGGTPVNLLSLNFLPASIAVDYSRQRAYLSDTGANHIYVYSLATGALLYTI